jgi:hypothetical protein
MSEKRSLFVAVDLDGDGAHPAAWRDAGRPPGAVLTAQALRRVVAETEAAGFVLAAFEDNPVHRRRPPDAWRPVPGPPSPRP